MKQIGFAIASYAYDHGSRFPDDLDTILETEDVTSAVVICPSGNDVPMGVPTSQPVGTKFLTSGHVSYIYVGKGLNTQTATPDVVALYEPLGNHTNAGMNVLFGDFHVEWLTAAQVKPILKQVAAGVFPIRLPPATTQPFPNP
jgi:prepilin-type processing-associated H-X9-DG protein